MSRAVILVYGDSLSLPRSRDEVHCLDTYPELLRRALEASARDLRVGVLNRSLGGATIDSLYAHFVRDSAYLGAGAAHILVIQCGIVDCAPRPVSPGVKAGIGRLPTPLRWAIARLLHYARPLLLKSGLSWRNTEGPQFAEVLEQWIARATKSAERIYVVNIAPPTPSLDRHSPGLASSIDAYNAAIAKVVAAAQPDRVRLVDVHCAIISRPDGLSECINQADGHHITAAGHRLYAQLIAAHELAEAHS